MLYFVDGDMWSRAANIHVNTVNCNGVMGKGVALAFARHYPKMLTEYRKATIPRGGGVRKPSRAGDVN